CQKRHHIYRPHKILNAYIVSHKNGYPFQENGCIHKFLGFLLRWDRLYIWYTVHRHDSEGTMLYQRNSLLMKLPAISDVLQRHPNNKRALLSWPEKPSQHNPFRHTQTYLHPFPSMIRNTLHSPFDRWLNKHHLSIRVFL